MLGLLSGIAGIYAARLREDVRRGTTRAVGVAIALVLVVVALGFLLAAGYMTLARLLGPVSGALIVAGSLVLVAALVWGITALATRERARPDLQAQLTSTLAAAQESLNPEQLALKSGQALARHIGPLQLAAIAVAAGFILARRTGKK